MSAAHERITSGPPLTRALGVAGAIIGILSLLSFGFSLVVLLDEYDHPIETGRAALHQVFGGWVRSDDYLGYTLVDRVDRWRSAPGAERTQAERLIRRTVRDLGDAVAHDDSRFRVLRVERLDLGSPGLPPLATWRHDPTGSFSKDGDDPSVDRVEVSKARGPDDPRVDLVVTYRVSDPVASAIRSVDSSYHRLVLALLGLSGYSLLCLGYMARHAQSQRERIAREAAAAATLDLADRTCHELGNVAFVVANERRNLAGHIELLERFVNEDAEVFKSATRRAGIDPATATRLEHALRREYADRGIDPEFELKGSAAIARDVCRQIATCSDYIALTVRELDGHLKRTTLPVALEPVALAEIIHDSLALLAPRIEATSIQVEIPDPSNTTVLVLADRRLLIHALVNLVKNAIEAVGSIVPDTSPLVRLSVATQGETAWLIVEDNGLGMTQAERRRIFDAGYSTKATGRGLGLAIVRDSVAEQSGVLEVTSEVGTGTMFRIGLPIV